MRPCDPLSDAGELPYPAVQGTVVHNKGCERQAIIIGRTDVKVSGKKGGSWWPALIFDEAGSRVIEDDSCVNLGTRGWHIAEGFDPIGIYVPMPPPSVVLHRCGCDWCDDCENMIGGGDHICDTCDNHGSCGCSCGCEDTVYEDGDVCGYCENTRLCERCEEAHPDSWSGGNYCQDCQYNIDEETRLEAEAAKAAETAKQETDETVTIITEEGVTTPA